MVSDDGVIDDRSQSILPGFAPTVRRPFEKAPSATAEKATVFLVT
jgi:hypothetical protein